MNEIAALLRLYTRDRNLYALRAACIYADHGQGEARGFIRGAWYSGGGHEGRYEAITQCVKVLWCQTAEISTVL